MTVELVEFTDPGCSYAWGTEPKVRRLRWQYGHRLRWRRVVVGTAPAGLDGRPTARSRRPVVRRRSRTTGRASAPSPACPSRRRCTTCTPPPRTPAGWSRRRSGRTSGGERAGRPAVRPAAAAPAGELVRLRPPGRHGRAWPRPGRRRRRARRRRLARDVDGTRSRRRSAPTSRRPGGRTTTSSTSRTSGSATGPRSPPRTACGSGSRAWSSPGPAARSPSPGGRTGRSGRRRWKPRRRASPPTRARCPPPRRRSRPGRC